MILNRLLTPIVLFLFSIAMLFPDVINKDKPQHGEWDFKLEKVWEIDSAGDEVLGHPQGIMVSDKGILFVSDSGNKIDYIFGEDGHYIRSFAERGEGPGEVQRHGRFFYANDKVIIPDVGRIHYFSGEGEYLTTIRKDCEPHVFIDENRLIDAPLSAVFLPDGKGKIMLCDLQSGKDTVISEFSAFEGGVARSSGMVMDVIVPVFSPLMTVGYAGDQVFWGMSDSYLINVTNLEGRDITSFSIDRKKTKVSKRDKRDFFKTDRMPAVMLKQIMDSMPDEVSSFYRIEVHNKLIFVFIPEVDLENKSLRIKQIDIFSPEGKYVYKAHLKFEKNRIHLTSPFHNIVIKNSFLYVVLQDEDDNVLVAKYKISLPTL